MSGLVFLHEQNKIVPFGSYVSLEESIQPKETNFGADGKDSKWVKGDGFEHTFFSHNPTHHVMVTRQPDGVVGFAARSGKFSNQPFMYDTDRTKKNDSHRVFGKVLHVVLHDKPKTIKFSGEDEKLSYTYDKFVENKHILKMMHSNGYEYHGKENGHHHFERF